MRSHHVIAVAVIAVACLGLGASLAGEARPTEPLVGTWELVGIGDQNGNFVRPNRLVVALAKSGRFDYRVWDADHVEPFVVVGDWSVSDGVITMSPENAKALKVSPMVDKIGWDGGTLVLTPVDDKDGDSLPFRFQLIATTTEAVGSN